MTGMFYKLQINYLIILFDVKLYVCLCFLISTSLYE